MEASLNFGDPIVTSYRDHCTHLGRGGTHLEVRDEQHTIEVTGRVPLSSRRKDA